MGKVEISVALLSFIWALALTRVLEGAGGLWLARRRIRFALSPVLWMLAILLAAMSGWLPLAAFGDRMQGGVFLGLLVYAMGLFFAATVVSPKVPETGVLDLGEYETREGAAYKLTLVLLMLVAPGLDYAVAPPVGGEAAWSKFWLGEWSVGLTLLAYLAGMSRVVWLRTGCALVAVALAARAFATNLGFL